VMGGGGGPMPGFVMGGGGGPMPGFVMRGGPGVMVRMAPPPPPPRVVVFQPQQRIVAGPAPVVIGAPIPRCKNGRGCPFRAAGSCRFRH
jgi:hypothetical protein